jgi:hypothetical protein
MSTRESSHPPPPFYFLAAVAAAAARSPDTQGPVIQMTFVLGFFFEWACPWVFWQQKQQKKKTKTET